MTSPRSSDRIALTLNILRRAECKQSRKGFQIFPLARPKAWYNTPARPPPHRADRAVGRILGNRVFLGQGFALLTRPPEQEELSCRSSAPRKRRPWNANARSFTRSRS